MSLQSRLGSLVSAIGADIKSLQSQINAIPPQPSRLIKTPANAANGTADGWRLENPIAGFTETNTTGYIAIGISPTFEVASPAANFMLRMKVSGYDYGSARTWEVIASVYDTTGTALLGNVVSVSGNPGPVRWGFRNGRLHLLIGNDTQVNNFVGINVDSIDVWYGYNAPDPTLADLLDMTVTFNTTVTDYTAIINADSEYAWQAATLVAPWVNYGTTFQTTRYRLRPDGVVEIQGLVKLGATNGTILNLPVGYRPDASLIFPVFMAGGVCRLDIGNTGVVSSTSWPAGATNAFLSLGGVSFTAAGKL